jgi:hypothetical protein
MKFDDDALDDAILSLPLEEPPPELRTEILAATVFRDAPLLSIPEGIALGGIAAALVWIAFLLVPQIGGAVADAFSDLSTLAWLSWFGIGTAATILAVLFTESQSPRGLVKAGNPAHRA